MGRWNTKKSIITLILAIFLLSIAGVCASDANDTAIASEDITAIELSQSEEITTTDEIQETIQPNGTEILTASDEETTVAQNNSDTLSLEEKTYADLSNAIGQGGDINLQPAYYKYNGESNSITIRAPQSIINGNGAIIDMAGSKIPAFIVRGPGVTFNNLTIKNVNSSDYGGAIHFNGVPTGTVTNCNFANNYAGDGGAVYFLDNGRVTNCNFTNNSADATGGAVRLYSGSVENCIFTNNKATGDYGYGGAIYFSTGSAHAVANCYFTGNIANYGSAMYFWSASSTKTVSNSILLNNRARVDDTIPLNVVINENNIEIIFKGQNNLLNAIYSRGDVSFTNVTYWGANGITNTGISTVTPSRSNNEAGQNITVGVVVNDELVLNEIKVTDENGTIVLDVKVDGDYYIRARHDEDSYYTGNETISHQGIQAWNIQRNSYIRQ